MLNMLYFLEICI
uniref:Uncharacterized protein n=1 Tax=Rhizophora mucronata TaxID=61149 RepID=A0A2P2P1V3_RHIMU